MQGAVAEGEGRSARVATDDIAIRVSNLSKCYHIYDRPEDRLKQSILPRVQRLIGRSPRNYFREFWALKDVSFEVKKGETVGIIGRNGSGKSTLLQIICGTLAPTSGTVETNGRIAALLELGSGFNPEFTGRENVYMNGAVLGLSKEEIDARFDDIAAFADIGQFIEQPVKTYSSGMVVRLAFAVAIHVEPSILVVDEALSVGDERYQRKCFSRIEALRRRGVTILFVSHSAGTVVQLCDRALLLDEGELVAEGESKRVVAAYQRLLYAPGEQRGVVRQALRAGQWTESANEGRGAEVLASEAGTPLDDHGAERESFDPHLVPTSTVHYEARGARISDWCLFNAEGQRVNHLVRGRRYRYRYRVVFEQPTVRVRFGMMIRTVTGIELGGAASSPLGAVTIERAEPGMQAILTFEFICRLAPGTYFLNAGVVAELQGEETYVHRVLDALMFRVLPEIGDVMTGIVDFSCNASLVMTAAEQLPHDAALVAERNRHD